MAILLNWTCMLEESLLQALSREGLSFAELERLRGAAALLEGSPESEQIARRLEERLQALEQKYSAALLKTRSGKTVEEVEAGIAELNALGDFRDATTQIEAAKQHIVELNYDAAVQKIQTGKKAADIEEGIAGLRALGDYRDATAQIEAAKKRVAGLKWRARLPILATVAAFMLLVAVLVIHSRRIDARVNAVIGEAQTLVDAGKNRDALALITDLAGEGRTGLKYPDLYIVCEKVLENIAETEGFDAAFALYDELSGYSPAVAKASDFFAYTDARIKDDSLPAALRWELLTARMNYSNPSLSGFDKEAREGLLRAYAAELPADEVWPVVRQALVGKIVSVSDKSLLDSFTAYADALPAEEAWAELMSCRTEGILDELPKETARRIEADRFNALAENPGSGAAPLSEEELAFIDTLEADPDAALRLAYALSDAGYDLAGLFPNGIPVAFPMAERSSLMVKFLYSDSMEVAVPDMSTVLPISVTEHEIRHRESSPTGNPYLPSLSGLFGGTTSTLQKGIEDEKAEDSHYSVRLLTQYLSRIPETLLPDSFAECSSLLCMQNSYAYKGSVTHTTEYTSNGIVTSKTTREYALFSAVDMVAVYDAANAGAFSVVSLEEHSAQAEDDEWFEANKKTTNWSSTSALTGSFEPEALCEEYESDLDNLVLIRLLVSLGSDNFDYSDYEIDEEAADDAA